MTRSRYAYIVVITAALLTAGMAAEAGSPVDRQREIEAIPDDWTWSQVSTFLKRAKSIELSDASIIIEVNSTDGDAGFQVFLDGDGWRNARVYDPNGRRILKVSATGGVRDIGGGTELFMESAEPPYEDLDGMQDLIELLPEGEYFFLARTTDNQWAIGEAELTHDVPAGPEIINPMEAEGEDECSTGVFVDSAFIEWDPVTMDIFGEELEIEAYQVIVEGEEVDLKFSVTVPGDITLVGVPEAALAPGEEFTFEVLAIEESGNQTITEGCFETEDGE